MTTGGLRFGIVEGALAGEVAALLAGDGEVLVLVVDPAKLAGMPVLAQLLAGEAPVWSLPPDGAGILADLLAWAVGGSGERPRDGDPGRIPD